MLALSRKITRIIPRRFGGLRCFLASAALLLSTVTTAEEDNDQLLTAVSALIGTHNFALPLSLLPPDPFVTVPASAVTFGTNLGLKYVKAPLIEPSDRALTPSAMTSSNGDSCDYEFFLPQSAWRYADILGLYNGSPIPDDWGELGKPDVVHANTEVIVRPVSRFISDLGAPPIGRLQTDDLPRSQTVTLPAGVHQIDWEATTQLDPIMDGIMPAAFLGFNIGKYGAAYADGGANAVRLLQKNQTWKETLIQWGIKGGLLAADQTGLFQTEPTVTHRRSQLITVHDVVDPVLTIEPEVVTLEATDFGGTLFSRVEEDIAARVEAFDRCGRPHSLVNDAPVLLPLGGSTISWTVSDLGPNLQGESNQVTRVQQIQVRDTQGPIIVAPPGRVVEIAAGGQGIPSSELQLGLPLVVDLADASPDLSSDRPPFYPVNSRANITWTATDDSGNSSSASQFITVKEAGTNTAPSVAPVNVTTLTSQPVDIVLTGNDADFLDGQFDPLSFSIESSPDNGEFVAPLLPYFINDFRTNPTGPYGEDFVLGVGYSGNRFQWMFNEVCEAPVNPVPGLEPGEIDRSFAYEPVFVSVLDDGTYFLIDEYWNCALNQAETKPRISKWTRDGQFIGQIDYSGNFDHFVLDDDGFIYVLNRESGSRNELRITQCGTAFEVFNGGHCPRRWKFDFASAPGIIPERLAYARVDSEQGLLYVSDAVRLFAFDVRDTPASLPGEPFRTSNPPHVGTLFGGERLLGAVRAQANNSCGSGALSGFTIDLDSKGNLYAADVCDRRIHKFTPSEFDESGSFVAGEYVGWLGFCRTSTNKACDADKQRSKGFSCTNDTCMVNDAFDTAGAEQGQLGDVGHLAVGPEDILYVVDSGNNRIQRFGEDGSFAGEAVSTGTGVNQGERPGFVLGNFGRPRTISVNSSNFYLVDQDEELVHIFQTSPFKDITSDSVTVTYVSEFSFHSGIDSFTYSATDGLATSSPASVSVQVNRNFRAPIAFAASAELDEDSSVEVALTGDDPDGIAGVDFNGLDTLSYRVIRQPARGTVSVEGDVATYTPFVDFNGADQFLYVANDGVLDSEPVEVSVNVRPVDDAPRAISIELPDAIGMGFETPLRGTFIDDGAQNYGTTVNWGDGSLIDRRGDFVEDDGAGEARLEGVKLIEPIENVADGVAIASHSYTSPGPKNVQWCIFDETGAATCLNKTVVVEPSVYLDLRIEAETDDAVMGNTVTLEVELTNVEPTGVPGMNARNVRIAQAADSQLNAISLAGAPIGCGIANARLECALGDLGVGESVRFDLLVDYGGSRFYTEFATAAFEASSDADSVLVSSLALPLVSFTADMTDSDGDGMTDAWEQEYGFNIAVDDSALDLDEDGLSNLDEFLNRTLPTVADTDSDGLSDGVEVAAGSNPTVPADTDLDGLTNDADLDDDNDGMSDAFERGFAFDPFDPRDALQDRDNDGFSNLAEAQAGTDPSDANDRPDMTSEAPTLFSSLLPLSRSTQVGTSVSAFATIINAGDTPASDCSFVPLQAFPGTFTFRPTNSATNEIDGAVNEVRDIAPGALQTYVFTFTPEETLDIEVAFRFACADTAPAPSFTGLNTFRLQASPQPTPDMVALAATASGDGIVRLAGGAGAFSVASVNVGAEDWITARPRVSDGLAAAVFVCETDPFTGQCINPVVPATEATVLVSDFATPTFSVFVSSSDDITLDPVNRRVALEFIDSNGTVRGGSSVAVQSD